MPRATRCAGILLAVLAAGVTAPARAEVGLAFVWEVESGPRLPLVWAGHTTTVRLRLKNDGAVAWSPETRDHVSYHWLRPDGSVEIYDGARTPFPTSVAPGDTVEVLARLEAPATPGQRVLQWELVREKVGWYGPPRDPEHARTSVLVVSQARVLGVGFVLLTGGLLLAVRRLRPAPRSPAWALVGLGPVLWTWLAVVVASLAFSDLAGLELAAGAARLVLATAALAALPVALAPGRGRRWTAAAIGVGAGVTVLTDLVYLRFFGGIAPAVAVLAVRQLGQVESSVRSLLRPDDIWALPVALAALLVGLLWPVPAAEERETKLWRRVAAAAAIAACLFGALPLVNAVRGALADRRLSEQVFSEKALIGTAGVGAVHVLDVVRTAREALQLDALPAKERARIVGAFRRRAAADAGAGEGLGVARGANLILIQVESLQEWVVGARFEGQPVMPFLAGLRPRAISFPYVFDQTGEGRSSDGEFIALNAQLPMAHGAVAFRRANNHFLALPEVLRRRGYTTLSGHAFERGFWNRAVLHPRYGFQSSSFQRELGPGETIGWGLTDQLFFERMVPRIEGARRPFFAFLITLGLHHPFDQFPDRHKQLDVGALAGSPLGNYLHAMHFFDASLRELVARLERDGVLENTVVALYGDHEAGLWVDSPLLGMAGIGGWDPSVLARLKRVPFVVLLPGEALRGEVPVVGGQVDIAPTLLYLLGIDRPPSFFGRVLRPGRAGVTSLWDGTTVDARRLFVASGPRIPPQGACFTFPDGTPLPLADCSAMVEQGRAEAQLSRAVVEHDLVPAIEAGGAR